MSNPAKPTWKEKILREAPSTDESVWLYEHAVESYILADANGLITLQYLSSEPMPMREPPGQAAQGGKQ